MNDADLAFDAGHIWHPYSSVTSNIQPLAVSSADGVHLTLADGRRLVDGMSSWWAAIHGYNHPVINAAAQAQLAQLPHVMFGGLTHQPAIDLCRQLVELTPAGLDKVFLSDSGSVAVEVAIKMALQYWQSQGRSQKSRLVALRGGYHGDTLGAMSVCDPVNGMHHLFRDTLARQYFVERPSRAFGQPCTVADTTNVAEILEQHGDTIAAIILEPIVQGAGGMHFYSADYLHKVRQLCDEYQVLLIADEIATGFGRTGKLFACEHAGIAPDILCVGKAMTGGYLSLAATLTNKTVAEGIGSGEPGAFMHGPTFMGNPLACRIASASIQVLQDSDWQGNVQRIESSLQSALLPLQSHAKISSARVLGAIGVLETQQAVDMHKVQALLPELGVWLRPFGKLVYTMPPFITSDAQLEQIAAAMLAVVEQCS